MTGRYFEVVYDMLEEKTIYDAFLACKTTSEVKLFVKDLLSDDEIARAEDRWLIAFKHLKDPINFTQSKLKQLGFGSSDKIGRIIRPIREKDSGYKIVYERLLEAHNNETNGGAQ